MNPGLIRTMLTVFILLTTGVTYVFTDEIRKDDSIPVEFESILDSDGIDKAVEFLQTKQNSLPSDSLLDISGMIEKSVSEFSDGDRQFGIDMMLALGEFRPENVSVNSVLGQFFWYEDDRDNCIKYFKKTLELDPEHREAKIYMKRLFFVPDDFVPPQKFETKRYTIMPIKESHAHLDFEALKGSVEHLQGTFGPGDTWPAEVTIEENIEVLGWHEQEFAKRIGFVYTVMNHDETKVLGCIYIYPSRLDSYDAESICWVTKAEYDLGMDSVLYNDLQTWLTKDWPFEKVVYPGRSIDWAEFLDKIQ